MNIAVNTRLLIKGKLEGIGWFTFESLKRITIQHPEHHFYFIFDRPFDPVFIFSDNITPIVLFPPARHPFLFYIWFEIRLTALLKKLKPDLFLQYDQSYLLKTQYGYRFLYTQDIYPRNHRAPGSFLGQIHNHCVHTELKPAVQ